MQKRELQLKDVLAYLNHGSPEDSDPIQIVTGEREWEDYEEINSASELLVPFLDYYVWCMCGAKSDISKSEYCIRVDIHKERYGVRNE